MTDVGQLHAAIVAVGVQEFASRAGFKVDRRGRGACPVHGGKNPEQFSLTVKHGEVMVAHCFNCGLGCDAIDLVGMLRGRSDFAGKLEAVAELLNMGPMPASSQQYQPEPDRIDPLSYHNIVTSLREICLQFRPIRDVCQYLQRRKLIGLASEFGLFALPQRSQQREVIGKHCKQFATDALIRSGLLYQSREGVVSTGALMWSDARLCIPWVGPDDKISALQRRVICDVDGPRYVFPRGIRPMHPYGAAQLKTAPKDHAIAFCEGALDTIALTAICRREGYPIIALGLPGVDGWRESYSDLCRGRRVYLAFDNDEAGTKAFAALAPQLHDAGVAEIHRWQPERGNDWGDELIGIAS